MSWAYRPARLRQVFAVLGRRGTEAWDARHYVADRVVAGVVHAAQLLLLFVGKLGPLATQLATSTGHCHALAGA